MSEVYIVSSGTYSDYQIRAIYSDKDAAEKMAEWWNGRGYYDEYRVEAYRLNESRPAYAGPVWQSVWWATYLKGAPEPAEAHQDWYEGDDPGNATAFEGEDYHYDGCPYTTRYVRVVGHSKEHVEKSANDRRQRVRAELLGLA